MQIRLNKKNSEYIEGLMEMDGCTANEAIALLIRGTPTRSQQETLLHIYDLLGVVYEDTQNIKESLTKSDLVQEKKEKLLMSKLWGNKRINYKAHRDAGGSNTETGWVTFEELLGVQPYKTIKGDIDSGEYALD